MVFEELLSRDPNFSPAGDAETLPSGILNAVERMPVEFRPSRDSGKAGAAGGRPPPPPFGGQ